MNGHLEDNLAIYDPETRNADELGMKGWLHEDGARKLFEAAGMDMDAALAAAKRPGFKSFSLKVKGDVKLAVSYDIQQTRNVAGILPGASKPDEAIVMSAGRERRRDLQRRGRQRHRHGRCPARRV